MDGTLAEIRLFAGNFPPRGWNFCQGQILPIAQYTALFSLLGTTYGGNGSTTFALPDLRGRTVVGAGQGPGLPSINLGQMSGEATHTLIITEMPAHNHTTTATTTLKASSNSANSIAPGSNVLAANGSRVNVYTNSAPNVDMAAAAATTNVIVGIAGGSQPHNNMQPYLGLNYIICMDGIFPSRN